MQAKIFALLAIILVAQQIDAGTINLGDLMGDVSKVAVAGEKVIHQLENKLNTAAQDEVEHVETAMQNLLSDMANGLGDLANDLNNLQAQRNYVQPTQYNLIGSLMGDMGNALGHLANTITSLSMQIQTMPKTRSVSSSGASIIGEVGGLSAQAIASAAHVAAPYVKQLNNALGNLANSLTHL